MHSKNSGQRIEEHLQQEKSLLVAADQHQLQDAAMEQVFETQDRVHASTTTSTRPSSRRIVQLERSAEVLRTHRRFEDRHRQADRNRRQEEKSGQNRAVPEGMQLVGHDEIHRAQRRLMQGRKDHAADDDWNRDLLTESRSGFLRLKCSSTIGANSSDSTVV